MSTDTTTPPAEGSTLASGAVRTVPTAPDAEYLDWLLHARTRPEVRSALRRGDIDAAADRAYRYLARFWAGRAWLRTPILLPAAATATHIQSRHAEGKTLGEVAADLVRDKVLSTNTVSARLLAVQRMDLPVAHRHLAGILHAAAANRLGVDWMALYNLYRNWDQPLLNARRRTRRTLLEQFHTRVFS